MTTAQSLPAVGVVPFTLRDGTSGVIAPEARRVYDHIIRFRIGTFPLNGLTDTQAKLILQGARLAENDLEYIWQLTESIVAPGFPDGSWTKLEIYVALHFSQAIEQLSLNQMALHYAGSLPPESTSEIRRRSSYAEAGLALRPEINHDPMPASSSPPLTAFRHSTSIMSTLAGVRDLPVDQMASDQVESHQDTTSVIQPGLETMQPYHASTFRHLGASESLLHTNSLRSDTTSGAQRLASLIQSRCPNVEIEPDIERFQPKPVEPSVVDRCAAREILVRKRREGPKYTDPSKGMGMLLRSKKEKQKAADCETWTFKSFELSTALRETVEESSNVGVAKELIEMGADVHSFHQPKSKLIGSRTESIPINYAKIAANKNNVDMVSLFAISGLSPNKLIDALEQAVEQNLPSIVLGLLQHGVDPNSRNGSIFGSAIASQNPALVKLLLRSRLKIRQALLTQSLPTAVEKGQTEVVSLLVKHGADTEHDNASAFRKAVQAQRIDLLLVIMKGVKNVARSNIASSVFGEAFPPSSSLTVPEQRLLIEILLCAGAKGDPVARMLAPIVRAGHKSIARLLIKHGVDLHHNNAEALRVAVATENLDMISTLLLGSLSKDVASGLVGHIPSNSGDDRNYRILSLLIDKGARGSSLDQALLRAVPRKNIKIICLLLDHHARVDVEDYQPLRMAVTNGDLVILDLLLSKGRPQPDAMKLLLPLIPQSSPQLRLDMSKSIINTAGQDGVPTPILNDALLQALRHPLGEVDEILIRLVDVLILAGASPDCQRGKCFRLASEIESMRLLELLIHYSCKPASLLPAVHICMKMKDRGKRHTFIATLLNHGAEGLEVNQALVDATEEKPADEKLVLFLLEKADVEYREGQALSAAMSGTSLKLVESIINTGRTSQKSRLSAGQILFEPGTKERQAKLRLLLKAGVGQEGVDNALIRELRGQRNSDVVKILLDHDASCDYDGGKPLQLAIGYQDTNLLKQLLIRPPDHRILEAMVPKISAIKGSTLRHECLILLIQGGATGERISHALVHEVETPGRRDPSIIQLLVASGARIDYLDGRAVKFATSLPIDVATLKILVSGTAASGVLASLIPLAMVHDQRCRIPLLQLLLENNAHGDNVNAALVTAVMEGPKAQPTIDLLLKYNASVNYNKAEAIKAAAEAGSSSILECLLSKNPNPVHFEEALALAMKSPSSLSQGKAPNRLHSVRLLTRSRTARPGAVNSPLIQAVHEKDHDLVEYLINSGADPNHKDGESVVIATRQLDIKSLYLLARSKTKPTPQSYSRAFTAMPQNRDRWQREPELVDRIDNLLIPGGAAGPAVDQTFLSAVRSSHILAEKLINLILSCKTTLDVNFAGGRSICVAVRRAQFEIVDFLLSLDPNKMTLQCAFMAIFESGANEEVLIMLTQRFFNYSGEAKQIYFRQGETANDALYQTLHRHGDKPALLQTLLDNGCNTTSTFSWVFDERVGLEETSALLWLLCQDTERLDSRTVKILLASSADPNFRSPKSGHTPLIVAARSQQPDVVLQLLEADAQPDTQDDRDATALQYATMARSLFAMRHLISYKAEIDDESLHIAARQLDIPAIKLLLENGASTILPGTVHCGGRVPLGELCCMTDLRQNPPILKKTIKLLYEATVDLKMITNGKSFIFQALDNDSALKMITALLVSCQSIKDDINDSYNIFSNGFLRYSPTAYVRHFKCIKPSGYPCLDFSRRCCTLEACPAPNLEKLLRNYKCKDRFWDTNAGYRQPKGFCSPPSEIKAAIIDANNQRREQERLARANAEEKARQDRAAAAERARKDEIQRELDVAAAAERNRERERLRVIEEQIQATQRKAAAEKRAIEQRTEAEIQEKRRLAAEEAQQAHQKSQREQREYDAQAQRERDLFEEQQGRERQKNVQFERTLRERSNIQVDQEKRKANVQKELLKAEKNLVGEKRRFVESAAGMFREASYSGVNRIGMGRVLGEIDQ